MYFFCNILAFITNKKGYFVVMWYFYQKVTQTTLHRCEGNLPVHSRPFPELPTYISGMCNPLRFGPNANTIHLLKRINRKDYFEMGMLLMLG